MADRVHPHEATQLVLRRLRGHGRNADQIEGDPRWVAVCPAHERSGGGPSVRIDQHVDGTVSIHPHRKAGGIVCTPEQILAALAIDDPRVRPFQRNGRRAPGPFAKPARPPRSGPTGDSFEIFDRLTDALVPYTGRRSPPRYDCPACGAKGDGHGLRVDHDPNRSRKILLLCDSNRCPPEEILEPLGFTLAELCAGDDTDDLGEENVPAPAATDDDAQGRQVVLTSAADIRPRRVRWLWAGRLALGTLALLAGREGMGKSTFAYWLAARLTRGELPGTHYGHPCSVLVCATEDSWEHTIVPRLMAAGADLELVYRIEVVTAYDVHVGLSLPRDIAAARAVANRVGAGLLLLDPLMSRIDSGLDPHRDGEVRRALEPLVTLADQASLVVLGLIHLNKTGATDILDRVMASKAFVAVARSVSAVVPDPDDDSGRRRLFGTPKNNLGRDDLRSLTFTIEGTLVDTDDGPSEISYISLGDETTTTIHEAMERIGEDTDVRTLVAEAKDWLRQYLTDRGVVDSRDAKRDAHAQGFSESTLTRARKGLRVVVVNLPVSPRRSTWSLPPVVSPLRGGGITDLTDINTGQSPVSDLGGTSIRVSRITPPREADITGQLDDAPDCPDCRWGLDTIGHATNCEVPA
jgi:hypothetical protein